MGLETFYLPFTKFDIRLPPLIINGFCEVIFHLFLFLVFIIHQSKDQIKTK